MLPPEGLNATGNEKALLLRSSSWPATSLVYIRHRAVLLKPPKNRKYPFGQLHSMLDGVAGVLPARLAPLPEVGQLIPIIEVNAVTSCSGCRGLGK